MSVAHACVLTLSKEGPSVIDGPRVAAGMPAVEGRGSTKLRPTLLNLTRISHMLSCTAMLAHTLTRLQAAMCENLSYGSHLLLITHECSQPIEPASLWGWRPRRTGSGIRGRRDQPPLVEAPECTTAYQGGDVGGAAG